jgi:hypothetical protein
VSTLRGEAHLVGWLSRWDTAAFDLAIVDARDYLKPSGLRI